MFHYLNKTEKGDFSKNIQNLHLKNIYYVTLNKVETMQQKWLNLQKGLNLEKWYDYLAFDYSVQYFCLYIHVPLT